MTDETQIRRRRITRAELRRITPPPPSSDGLVADTPARIKVIPFGNLHDGFTRIEW